MHFKITLKGSYLGGERITFLIMYVSLHVVVANISPELRSIFPFKYTVFHLLQTFPRTLSSQSTAMAAACDFWQKERFGIANFLFPNSAGDCSLSP